MVKLKKWYICFFQLSLGQMNRALIATFLSFFLILSFPLLTHAAQVTLAWDASTDPSVVGYKVYYGTSSRSYQVVIDVGNNTTCAISNLQSGSTYYFATTGYSTSGVESGYSNEVLYSAPGTPVVTDTTPPTVTGFSIPTTATALTVSLTTFTATDNVGVTGYLLTESASAPSAAAAGWSPSPPGTYRFATAGTKTLYAWAKDAAGNVSTSLSAPVTITLNGPAYVPAILGIYRGGAWYWDDNGNGMWDGCGADTCIQSFGLSGDIPVAGDWTGDGILKIGVYRQGHWYLDKNGNGIWDGCGVDTCIDSFGGYPQDIPVVGDWTGTGIAKIGVYRQGHWYLDQNGNGIWDGCGVDTCIESFGGYPQDIPVVGDWTGTGIAKIGVFRQGQWYLDKNGNGMWDGCGVDTCIQSFGFPTDIPVVGDWTGTGIAKIGVYRQGQWYQDKNGNGMWDGCGVDTCIESFGGIAGDLPFTK